MLTFAYHRIGILADVAVEFTHPDGRSYCAGVLRFDPDGMNELLNFLALKDAGDVGVNVLYIGEIPMPKLGAALAGQPEVGKA